MAHAGGTLTHPVTGERLKWRQVATDTDGELLQADMWVRPGGFVAAAHIHPQQEERFEVLTGTAAFMLDGVKSTATAGQSVTVPAGHPHVWWNGGDDEVHVLVELRPALRTEVFFETFFGLAQDGKITQKGLPHLLQMAVILRAFAPEIRLAQPPSRVQAMLFAPLAALGRALGRRASYSKYSSKPLPMWETA
ncbi:cupin domain-containing protein [Hoyosella altamirensis]|uniref:Mannose-6-phosphate isomerase-like protein (Cupin superfamily) n=1 Tax=Hoyosella altamirensis TaxID=616997 RepID=A0A839RGI2_9ACTN|nr:cupin domain-containing protein [Hoyosella altamirensis]MBB3035715.1 mannose-6-phosphate isomerase-like protein (cupin superfamily) [Hoyosella altamirensis]